MSDQRWGDEFATRDRQWIEALKEQGLIPSCFNITGDISPAEIAEGIRKLMEMRVQAMGLSEDTGDDWSTN